MVAFFVSSHFHIDFGNPNLGLLIYFKSCSFPLIFRQILGWSRGGKEAMKMIAEGAKKEMEMIVGGGKEQGLNF
ncbi:hypothetical protein SLEP1_g36294 [Rubroshorea leprosula]|uniref:Uncharacterized protein n=1 Tax=Rubroshorea leprosula TaxID=152421 RepID=A0AAV5KQZ7_9ROSI|nr:hypothetical protein SLEP1_g36294 [Rubroshorea leprosula]